MNTQLETHSLYINKLLIVVNVQKKRFSEANKSKGFINNFVVVIKWY